MNLKQKLEEELNSLDLNSKEDFEKYHELKNKLYELEKEELIKEQIINDLEEG